MNNKELVLVGAGLLHPICASQRMTWAAIIITWNDRRVWFALRSTGLLARKPLKIVSVLCLAVEGWLSFGPADSLLGLDQVGTFCRNLATRKVMSMVCSGMFAKAPVPERRLSSLVLHVFAVPPSNLMDVAQVLAERILWGLCALKLRAGTRFVEEPAHLILGQVSHGTRRWYEPD